MLFAQVARFIAAIVVHPMWVNGGIVTTALSLTAMQAATLVFAVALWRRTASSKHTAASDPIEATVTSTPA